VSSLSQSYQPRKYHRQNPPPAFQVIVLAYQLTDELARLHNLVRASTLPFKRMHTTDMNT